MPVLHPSQKEDCDACQRQSPKLVLAVDGIDHLGCQSRCMWAKSGLLRPRSVMTFDWGHLCLGDEKPCARRCCSGAVLRRHVDDGLVNRSGDVSYFECCR